MAAGRRPGTLDGWCQGTVIDTGTMALCVTSAPGTVAPSVAAWSLSERLAAVIRRAASRVPGEAGRKLLAMISPPALAAMVAVLAAWAASHAVGIGEGADVLLIAGGIIFMGWEAVDAARHLGSFAMDTLYAASEADLDRAARHLTAAITITGVDAALILLTRGAVKAHRGRYRPTTQADATLPAGVGETDMYGNYRYSSAGSAQDQALARYHESVHSALSPKWQVLRRFRAEMGIRGYNNSAFLKYLEEALAEGYAQLRVNGIKGLPVAIRFPIAEEYVTLSAVLKEGAIGSVVVAGVVYWVHVEGTQTP